MGSGSGLRSRPQLQPCMVTWETSRPKFQIHLVPTRLISVLLNPEAAAIPLTSPFIHLDDSDQTPAGRRHLFPSNWQAGPQQWWNKADWRSLLMFGSTRDITRVAFDVMFPHGSDVLWMEWPGVFSRTPLRQAYIGDHFQQSWYFCGAIDKIYCPVIELRKQRDMAVCLRMCGPFMELDSTEEIYRVAAYIYSLVSPCWIRTLIACEMILRSLFLLSSEHHFSGFCDQIIIWNVLTRQLLHSLFLASCNLGWWSNQSWIYCRAHCKSLQITVSAHLPKWQCKVWMMIHTHRWKRRNICLALMHAATWKSPNTTRASYELSLISLLINSGWDHQWRRGETILSSLTHNNTHMLLLQFPEWWPGTCGCQSCAN